MIRLWRRYDGGLFARMIHPDRDYRVLVLGKVVVEWEKK